LSSSAVADALLVGKITLPSTILKFWDLGGQKGIRNIWPRYYDDCHAVVYVIDAEDRERLGEGWEVFGTSTFPRLALLRLTDRKGHKDSVLSNPQILNVPLLLLANKQDSPQSLSVDEIRRDYEGWFQNKIENSRRTYEYDSSPDMHHRRERIASLDVMGVSALEGCVPGVLPGFFNELTGTYRTGVRAAIDWIFIRVQNSRS
jgi:ADP-ribosylation factor related protein 1